MLAKLNFNLTIVALLMLPTSLARPTTNTERDLSLQGYTGSCLIIVEAPSGSGSAFRLAWT
ncbi:uncharacterized protein PHACADRAFT_202882 [Phanerochaete carnosa HHB-10118-sp]|uniref:Uncharacterized protein n=1 Tax=Phanerochaete carnosa (strain HHB-10118-sp) TaxID=650164 RepID=K5VP98_PHACS|nr:uncharacterized protein PHACADRAFT_202882 [Phanerochaete carnosa HHB-10118-sp]EKM48384.1 hypothetical protein PHACADRAFT_202882 [Phanerochaete carnosa HHB-10118-sp]